MKTEIRIWDPLVRLFHWSLVAMFSLSYITAESSTFLHTYSGYAVLGLISFRVIWGLIGTKHARFSDFIYSKKTVVAYLKSLITRNPKHYKGHNPAGGWMVIALLISLFVTTLSGLQLYAIEDGAGPFAFSQPDIQLISSAYADNDSHDSSGGFSEDFWEEIHEASANFTVLLILIHIMGVFVASVLHKENLVKAMISGKKKA